MANNILKNYLTNYTYGDSINESISQARADKLARDLQTQKLQQDALMETQRQALAIKSQEIQHSQNKEMTYEQRIENQIDREFNANFKADLFNVSQKFDKYKFDTVEKNSMDKFMMSNLWEEDRIEQSFQNELSRINFTADKELEMMEKATPIMMDRLEQQYGVEFGHLKNMEELTDHQKYMDFILTDKLAERAYVRLKDSPDYKMKNAQADYMVQTLSSEKLNAEQRNEYMSKRVGLPALLSKYGFQTDPNNLAWGNWSVGQSEAVLKSLQQYQTEIAALAKFDPIGEKHPVIWDAIRSEIAEFDRQTSGMGWGSFASWFRSMLGMGGGANQQKSNEMLEYIKMLLDTKQSAIKQTQ